MKSAKVYDRMKQHSLSTCDASMRCMECNPQYIYIYIYIYILCVYTYVVCVCANVYSMYMYVYINMSMYPSPLWMWWGVGHTCIHTCMYASIFIIFIAVTWVIGMSCLAPSGNRWGRVQGIVGICLFSFASWICTTEGPGGSSVSNAEERLWANFRQDSDTQWCSSGHQRSFVACHVLGGRDWRSKEKLYGGDFWAPFVWANTPRIKREFRFVRCQDDLRCLFAIL